MEARHVVQDGLEHFGHTKRLIVVPARGGSKGIPRKNVRMLAGQPLLSYALRAAMRVSAARVAVSTDDEEIANIASTYGATVLERPSRLAEDDVTLDDVVVDAVQRYESLVEARIPVVVTIQPTSPLVSTSTITSAIEAVENGEYDCAITVTDARHLYWAENGSEPVPLYHERQNRQWLPPLWKETGAVVASSRCLLDQGVRIGARVALVKVPRHEAVDIDSWDDWVVAESRLLAPKVVIRVTGDKQTGLGHAYRALTLAGRLPVPPPLIAINEGSELAREVIARSNYHIEMVPTDEAFVELIKDYESNLVVNDVLDTSTEYMESLRREVRGVIVNFEDLGPGARYADLVINALYEYSTPLPNQRCGWQYVCLRDEFLLWKPPVETPAGRKILVAFGGTDPNNLTARAIRAVGTLARKRPGLALQVVVGPGNERREEYLQLLKAVGQSLATYDLTYDTQTMTRAMFGATVAITSNGRTVFELASLGIPMVTINQNAREATHTFARLSGGAVDLGLAMSVREETISETLKALLGDESRLEAMRSSLRRFDLRAGTTRVVNEIIAVYRHWREDGSFSPAAM